MQHVQQIAFFLLLTVSVGLALWKGGAPEKGGVIVILTMAVFEALAINIIPSRFDAVDPGPLLSDLIGALGFGFLAIQAFRIWPLWATALQLLSLAAHFARWADIAVPKIVYALMRGMPTFMVFVVLLIGTILHMARLRRRGYDPSWQNWSRAASA